MSPDLAGANPVGASRRLVGSEGFTIAAFDTDGHITGYQCKTDKGVPKYSWVSSNCKGGNGPQLPDGELPLFVWKHPSATTITEVWLLEGALKPMLVAFRLWREGRTDIAVIGTASAARFGETTLQAYLSELGVKDVRVMPDAGALANPAIHRANQETLERCLRWGCSVTVGWWGQQTKNIHPDIDELASFDAIAYLTPEEYLALAPQPEPSDARPERTISPDEWQIKFGLPEWLKHQVKQFKNIFKRDVKLKATAEPSPKPPKPLKFIWYVPGELPTPERYVQMGCPKIRFKAGQRLELLDELVARAYRLILDSSATGTFKSNDAGLATPERYGLDRLWYFSQDHRNPTTRTVEANYTDMPVRNDGMVVDESRRTALNNPHERWPKKGELPTTERNCSQTKAFHTLSEKGFQFEVGVEAKINPICTNCLRSFDCAGMGEEATPGSGHSFRSDRRKVFEASSCIRASLDSAPNPKDLKHKNAQAGDDESQELVNGAFVDEAMRELNPVTLVNADLADLDKLMAELEEKLPIVHGQIREPRLALRRILAREVKLTRETYHGYSDATIREVIGEAPESLEEILSQLELIKPKLEEIFTEPDSFNLDGVDPKDRKDFSRETSKYLRDTIRRDSYREMWEKLRNLAPNWLIPFLKVWGGLEQGALRIKHGTLTVTTHNPRHAEVIKAMKFVVFMDATATREMLALYLGVDPTTIVQIEQEPPRYDNLTIVQVTGLGLVGHDRSDSKNRQVKALKQEFKQTHFDIGIIDVKEHSEGNDGWWFNQNRGSNEFKTRSALASFGIPYQDIGSLQAIYITLTGDRNVDKDAPGFSAFVRWHTQSEIAQAVGRLRANLRSNELLTYYFCADYDLDFLQEFYLGATIKKALAFSITPEAGNATEQSHHRVQQSIVHFAKQTGTALEKLTQTVAAKAAGVSQGRISQVAAKYGGWMAFKKLLVALFNSLYRTANNFEPLAEEHEFIASTYLPLVAEEDPPDAIEAMIATVKAYGWRVFEAILAATPIKTRAQLVAVLLSGLPADLQEELRVLAREVAF